MKKLITILSAVLVIGFTNAQTPTIVSSSIISQDANSTVFSHVYVTTFSPSLSNFTKLGDPNSNGSFTSSTNSMTYQTKPTGSSAEYTLSNAGSPINLAPGYDSARVQLSISIFSMTVNDLIEGSIDVMVNGVTTTFTNSNNFITFNYNKAVAGGTVNNIVINIIQKPADPSSIFNFNVKYYDLKVLAYSHGTETVITTGIATNELNDIKMLSAFPNPNNGSFAVQFETNNKITPVSVHDISGRLVLTDNSEREIGSNKISFDNALTTGMYIVKAGDKSFKMIVQ